MELYLLFLFTIIFLIFTGKCHGCHLMCGDISLQLKTVYTCKYCAKSYVKKATKTHLAKCIKSPQRLRQETSDKSPSTSIPGENY